MTRATQILRRSLKAVEDLNLLKVLQCEISHEISSVSHQEDKCSSLGDFVVDWNSLQSEDIVLRRKSDSGEEVAVSALLGRLRCESICKFPREVFMKVCVSKPGLSSVLQFDCEVFEKGDHGFDIDIHSANYLQSTTIPSSSVYRGPSFSSLDPQLQDALKEYLGARGIEENLIKFIVTTLYKKEEAQYLKWLEKIETFVAKNERNRLLAADR